MSVKNQDHNGTEIGAYSSQSRRSRKVDQDHKDLLIQELKLEIVSLRENQLEIDKMGLVLKDLEQRCNNYELERVSLL